MRRGPPADYTGGPAGAAGWPTWSRGLCEARAASWLYGRPSWGSRLAYLIKRAVWGEGRQLIIREAQLGQQPGGQAVVFPCQTGTASSLWKINVHQTKFHEREWQCIKSGWGMASFCQIRIDVNFKQLIKFPRIFQYAVQNTKNYYTFDSGEKDTTLLTGNVVTKSKKNSDFPPCIKFGERSACGSATIWCKFGSGSASKWKFGTGSGSGSASKRPVTNIGEWGG